MSKRLDMRKGSTTVLILSLLAEEPMYGYQISKELLARSGGVFDFKEGTLYPALHKLEKRELVTAEWRVAPNGRRRRVQLLELLLRRQKPIVAVAGNLPSRGLFLPYG